MPEKELPQYLRVEEVAELARLSVTQIYRLAAAGKVPSFKLGRRRLFKRGQIIDWIEGRGGEN